MNLSKVERKTRERFPGLSEKNVKFERRTHMAQVGGGVDVLRSNLTFFQKFLLSRISDITCQ